MTTSAIDVQGLRKRFGEVVALDGLDLEVPTGIPFRYHLADDLSVVSSGYMGDPEAARAAAEAVSRQAG